MSLELRVLAQLAEERKGEVRELPRCVPVVFHILPHRPWGNMGSALRGVPNVCTGA